jgi:hypothetical protein
VWWDLCCLSRQSGSFGLNKVKCESCWDATGYNKRQSGRSELEWNERASIRWNKADVEIPDSFWLSSIKSTVHESWEPDKKHSALTGTSLQSSPASAAGRTLELNVQAGLLHLMLGKNGLLALGRKNAKERSCRSYPSFNTALTHSDKFYGSRMTLPFHLKRKNMYLKFCQAKRGRSWR